MKKILLVSAILSTLAGCSSDDPVPTSEDITHALLNGTWLQNIDKCEAAGAISYLTQLTFNNGTGEETLLEYANETCTGTGNPLSSQDITYTFGDDVTVDGSVDGITAAHQINITYPSRVEYNIFAIKDLITLHTGAQSMTTPETRPTQLSDITYTVQ